MVLRKRNLHGSIMLLFFILHIGPALKKRWRQTSLSAAILQDRYHSSGTLLCETQMKNRQLLEQMDEIKKNQEKKDLQEQERKEEKDRKKRRKREEEEEEEFAQKDDKKTRRKEEGRSLK